ncbi:MAG: hypothetical protein LIO93_10200 [Bacteroidales bacterium]|nr:hypothetical protein [Bacteroidales bacterium]
MIPTVMYKEMSGAGVISVSGLMNLIGFRRKNKKGQVSFSEKEKEIINEKTNELITIELMGDSLDINKENLTEIIE